MITPYTFNKVVDLAVQHYRDKLSPEPFAACAAITATQERLKASQVKHPVLMSLIASFIIKEQGAIATAIAQMKFEEACFLQNFSSRENLARNLTLTNRFTESHNTTSDDQKMRWLQQLFENEADKNALKEQLLKAAKQYSQTYALTYSAYLHAFTQSEETTNPETVFKQRFSQRFAIDNGLKTVEPAFFARFISHPLMQKVFAFCVILGLASLMLSLNPGWVALLGCSQSTLFGSGATLSLFGSFGFSAHFFKSRQRERQITTQQTCLDDLPHCNEATFSLSQ